MTAARPAWRGLVIPSVFAAAALAVLLGLGTWQVERRAWKEALIGEITQRLAAAPGELPPPASWPGLEPAAADFRRVSFRAELLHDREAFIYTSGSALRSDASGIGYWVFTPARLLGGELVLLNRGFVPEARRDPAARAAGNLSGPVEIIGAIRAPERPGWFTPGDQPAKNLWFARDPAAIAQAKGLGPVAPFYVEQEAPVPPGGLPHPAKLQLNVPNNHLQYAITWYGLAAVLVAVFGAFCWSQRREAARSRPQ